MKKLKVQKDDDMFHDYEKIEATCGCGSKILFYEYKLGLFKKIPCNKCGCIVNNE